MTFQRVINQQPAPAVAGDFASNNPRSSVIPPVDSGFVAAAGEAVTVGYFAWGGSDGKVYSNKADLPAGGSQLGFVARQPNEPSALITAFLGESVMTLQQGLPVTLLNSGDYWAPLKGGNPGDTVYATAATGAPTTDAAAGANPDTGFKIVAPVPVDAVTDNATTIAANTGVMTVAAVASGVIVVGQRVTGVGVPDETFVTGQLTGAAGGAGTYQTNSVDRAAVAAFTATMVQGGLAKISRVAA